MEADTLTRLIPLDLQMWGLSILSFMGIEPVVPVRLN